MYEYVIYQLADCHVLGVTSTTEIPDNIPINFIYILDFELLVILCTLKLFFFFFPTPLTYSYLFTPATKVSLSLKEIYPGIIELS